MGRARPSLRSPLPATTEPSSRTRRTGQCLAVSIAMTSSLTTRAAPSPVRPSTPCRSHPRGTRPLVPCAGGARFDRVARNQRAVESFTSLPTTTRSPSHVAHGETETSLRTTDDGARWWSARSPGLSPTITGGAYVGAWRATIRVCPGALQGQADFVPLHARKPDPPVIVGDKPGDRALHHR